MTSGRYGTDAYAYDPLGNVRTNGATTWHYNAATNRVSDENGTAYGYDARGNTTSIGGFAPTWNLANEQVADSLGGGYAYDARGWRVKQTGGGHTRYFVYDANHQLIERIDNSVATDFIAIGSLPIARIVPTYIHADYQNTPLFETNGGGAITRNPDYLAYGQPVDAQGTAQIPGYTGAAPDKDTGLLYLGARYLRAPRFLSVDPAGLDPTSPMGLNRYAYANNNPARFTDPDGRCADADFGCGALARNIAAQPETYNAVGPYVGAAAGALAVAPLAYGLGVAALTNPVAATNIVNGAAEALAGDALGGSSLVVGGAAAAKGADTIAEGMRISTNRLTGSGETFVRYESANPAFSKVTEGGGVKPGTFAAPASDGIVPTAERVSVYNLPNPEIPRPNAMILKPPPGTPIIGPRPVVGGTGNEVVFPFGYKP